MVLLDSCCPSRNAAATSWVMSFTVAMRPGETAEAAASFTSHDSQNHQNDWTRIFSVSGRKVLGEDIGGRGTGERGRRGAQERSRAVLGFRAWEPLVEGVGEEVQGEPAKESSMPAGPCADLTGQDACFKTVI